MGDDDGGGAGAAQGFDRFAPNLFAKALVQVRKRLVHQQDRGFGGKRACQGHALLFAARQRMGIPVQQMRDADTLGHLDHAGAPRGAGQVAQPEGQVIRHVQMGKQGIVLEHEADLAVLGFDEPIGACHLGPADADAAARVRAVHAGNDPQQGRFSASRLSQKAGDPARRNSQRDVRQHRAAIEMARHLFQFQR